MQEAKPLLFNSLHYYVISDDDTFWRVDQLLRWLSGLDKSKIWNVPLIANKFPPNKNGDRIGAGGVFGHSNCGEIHTHGWYQPALLTRSALHKYAVASRQYGTMNTCLSFGISQDVGIGIVAWMLELGHLRFPGVEINEGHAGVNVLKKWQIAVHGVRPLDFDDCEGRRWPMSVKYDTHMRVGCGTIANKVPSHNENVTITMYDAWNWFSKNGEDVIFDEDWTDGYPLLLPLVGYNSTSHYSRHNLTLEWSNFGPSDCLQAPSISPTVSPTSSPTRVSRLRSRVKPRSSGN